jgi:hypothetical protein
MKETILSILRHALTFGGALIAANNNISAGAAEAVTGALVALVGVTWGAVDEYKAAKKAKESGD